MTVSLRYSVFSYLFFFSLNFKSDKNLWGSVVSFMDDTLKGYYIVLQVCCPYYDMFEILCFSL